MSNWPQVGQFDLERLSEPKPRPQAQAEPGPGHAPRAELVTVGVPPGPRSNLEERPEEGSPSAVPSRPYRVVTSGRSEGPAAPPRARDSVTDPCPFHEQGHLAVWALPQRTSRGAAGAHPTCRTLGRERGRGGTSSEGRARPERGVGGRGCACAPVATPRERVGPTR